MMGKDFPNPWGKKTPKGEIKMMSQLLDSAVFPGIQGEMCIRDSQYFDAHGSFRLDSIIAQHALI